MGNNTSRLQFHEVPEINEFGLDQAFVDTIINGNYIRSFIFKGETAVYK